MTQRPAAEPRSAYPHYLEITTRWMDNDVYRHVNNVVYYSYFDTVVNQYLILAILGHEEIDERVATAIVAAAGE